MKGPRPKGMKKFKPIIEEAPETPVEELSVNQKRKIEVQKKKAEEERKRAEEAERLRLEEERLAILRAHEAEKERKKKIEAEKIAKQKAFE